MSIIDESMIDALEGIKRDVWFPFFNRVSYCRGKSQNQYWFVCVLRFSRHKVITYQTTIGLSMMHEREAAVMHHMV